MAAQHLSRLAARQRLPDYALGHLQRTDDAYLLAIGSTTYPVPASSWNAFSRPLVTFQDYTYISGDAPLFIHQYSHAWFDFRNKQDAYAKLLY